MSKNKSVSEQLIEFFRSNQGRTYASGEVQRREWRNKDNTLATPRSIVRRLEELCEDKIIIVSYGEKNHAYYSYGNPMKKVQEVEYVMRDGHRFARITYKEVPA